MKILLFVPIATLIFLCSTYVAWRSAQALFSGKRGRLLRFLFVLFLPTAFLVGLPLRASTFGTILRIIGVTWIISLPYWGLSVVLCEIVCLANRLFPFFPDIVKKNYTTTKRAIFFATFAAVSVTFAFGYWNFENPKITPVSLSIDKNGTSQKKLHAVFAADLHFGDLIGRDHARRYVEQINALKPDIILLGGDIVDRSLEPLIRDGVGDELKKLHAPLGVWGVLGNHERYSDEAACEAYLEACGIRILCDEVALVDNSFYLVGRRDVDHRDRKHRASAAELMSSVTPKNSVIFIDHQPADLAEAADAGANLQLSGHTHNGQVFPINWIVALLYEIGYGYGKHDEMQVYVTSGLGLWGFPARIGTDSEIVDLKIEFNE